MVCFFGACHVDTPFNSPTLTHNKTMSSIELFDNESDDSLSIGEQLSHARSMTISPPTMKKSHLHQHPKFHANEADDSHSDDDYNFSDKSISSSASFDSNEKHILEEAYDEIIHTASFFKEETNNYHLDGKHNIGSNANGPTVVCSPLQPLPTVSAAS